MDRIKVRVPLKPKKKEQELEQPFDGPYWDWKERTVIPNRWKGRR